MNVPVAANILGVAGAVCWSIQLIPQIIINYRRHHTEGLQPKMMMLWAIAGLPLAVYNVVEDFNIALKIQPQILTCLSLVTWTQCYYYSKKWPVIKCLLLIAPILCLMAGSEAALILALRIAKRHSLQWPSELMAVLAGVLLCTGVATHYVDIWKHRTVRGISFIFCGIDAAGDVFSLVSVLFEPTLDPCAVAVYAAEFSLWSSIFACGFYFNLLPHLKGLQGSAVESADADPPNLPPEDIALPDSSSISIRSTSSSASAFRTARDDSLSNFALRQRDTGAALP